MAPRKPLAKKLKKKDFPKITSDVYTTIPLESLVVYAIYFLEERKIVPTTEEIVSVCFRLFPNYFSLKNYPRWPDSALVLRQLDTVRARGLLKGDAVKGYAVKYKGKLLAIRIAKALGLVKPAPKKVVKKKAPAKTKARVKPIKTEVRKSRVTKKVQTTGISRSSSDSSSKKKRVKGKKITKAEKPVQLTLELPPPTKKSAKVKVVSKPSPSLLEFTKEEKVKAGRVVKMVEKSSAYRLYQKSGDKSRISEFDFRDMLLSTMESSAETLKRNVELFKRYALIESRSDLIRFFTYCEVNFEALLTPQIKKKKR